MPDTDKAALRPRQEIEAAREGLQGELEETIALGIRGEAYFRGQLAALDWVLGAVAEAPLTGQVDVDVSNTWALGREEFLATEMLYGRVERDRRGIDYISGVEHALMWVRTQSDEPL